MYELQASLIGLFFFSCFNFTVTNPPDNKNHKADAVSHKHDPEQINHPIVTILPPSVVIAQISWGIMRHSIQQVQQDDPLPPECPMNRQFVPQALCH